MGQTLHLGFLQRLRWKAKVCHDRRPFSTLPQNSLEQCDFFKVTLFHVPDYLHFRNGHVILCCSSESLNTCRFFCSAQTCKYWFKSDNSGFLSWSERVENSVFLMAGSLKEMHLRLRREKDVKNRLQLPDPFINGIRKIHRLLETHWLLLKRKKGRFIPRFFRNSTWCWKGIHNSES